MPAVQIQEAGAAACSRTKRTMVMKMLRPMALAIQRSTSRRAAAVGTARPTVPSSRQTPVIT